MAFYDLSVHLFVHLQTLDFLFCFYVSLIDLGNFNICIKLSYGDHVTKIDISSVCLFLKGVIVP